MNHSRTQPVIGWPRSVGIGACTPISSSGTSNCQPTATSVKPSRSSEASPKCASAVGSSAASALLKVLSRRKRPRLTTSKNTTPLPRAGSLGLRMKRSAENSTLPSRLRGARLMSAMIWLRGCAGIDREEGLAPDLLVGAGGAERAAAEHVDARGDLDADELRGAPRRDQDQDETEQGAHRHDVHLGRHGPGCRVGRHQLTRRRRFVDFSLVTIGVDCGPRSYGHPRARELLCAGS